MRWLACCGWPAGFPVNASMAPHDGRRMSRSQRDLLDLLCIELSSTTSCQFVVSFGSENPKAEGHSEEDFAQNRRSDMVYAGAALSK